MKIYAKQVPAEYQESPLFMEEWPENVFVFGNRYYRDHGGDYIENIKNSMYDAADELKRVLHGEFSGDYSLIEILNDFLEPENGREYSRAERLQWRDLLLSFSYYSDIDDDAITAALELITGRKYECAEIRGCCQGDWNNIIYPSEYGREWLEYFETEYFNTGTEWRICEDDPDSDDAYYYYTHEWSEDGQRAEIAAAAGVDPADVVFYVFDHWERTPIYKEVYA